MNMHDKDEAGESALAKRMSVNDWKPSNKAVFQFDWKHISSDGLKLVEMIKGENQGSANFEVCNGVYCFPLFTEKFCNELVTEVEDMLEQTGDSGVALRAANFGLDKLINETMRHHIGRIVSFAFPSLKNIDHKTYSKLMTYKSDENDDWPVHTDGDFATINISLGKDYQGGFLRFYSDECAETTQDHYTEFKPEIGNMIIHLGHKRHSVNKVTAGTRYSLIVKMNDPNLNY